jgi:hypothetical protein
MTPQTAKSWVCPCRKSKRGRAEVTETFAEVKSEKPEPIGTGDFFNKKNKRKYGNVR